MRTKKLLLSLTLLFAVLVQVQAVSLDKKIIGQWQYSAPTAPSPYGSGQINFIQDGEKLKGEIVIEGQKVEFSQITFKGEEVSVTINLESTPVTVKLKMVDEKLEGSAESPDGPVTITAVRKK